MRVTVYQIDGHGRSNALCAAMLSGIRAAGDSGTLVRERRFGGEPVGDAAVFYGFSGRLPAVMAAYRHAGKPAVFIDLGYWGRKTGGHHQGYHKLAVNDRHPTAYFRARAHGAERFARLGVEIAPWQRHGRHILLCGMGAKAARSLGFGAEAWERQAIAALRAVTDRPIHYRPKPSWLAAVPIEGTIYSHGDSLGEALAGAHAVVTHHSNAAVEAVCAGVPCFTVQGVALAMGSARLKAIETPLYPDDRAQWAADVAWTQFTTAEIAAGLAWRHLRDEGLV